MTTKVHTPRASLALSVTDAEALAFLAREKTLVIVPAKHAPELRRGRWCVDFSRSRSESFATEAEALAAMPRPFWPGRTMHVREAWAAMRPIDPFTGERVVAAFGLVTRTKPDGLSPLIGYRASVPRGMEWADGDGFASNKSYWRSAASMPRWASRILLSVTASSLMYLHDLTDADIAREGSLFGADNAFCRKTGVTPRQRYEFVWSVRYGASHAWRKNPRVWRVETEVLDIARPDEEKPEKESHA